MWLNGFRFKLFSALECGKGKVRMGIQDRTHEHHRLVGSRGSIGRAGHIVVCMPKLVHSTLS